MFGIRTDRKVSHRVADVGRNHLLHYHSDMALTNGKVSLFVMAGKVPDIIGGRTAPATNDEV
jgi:hypothetical protein